MNERINILKEKIRSEPRYVSIEQAKIITQSYKEHENDSRILQRAYSLKAALEHLTIHVNPEELIVGNRTSGIRCGVVFPESGCSWIDSEFETLPTRAQDKFLVKQEDIEYFRSEIKPYWKGKSLEDVLFGTYGEEIKEISRVVKINQKDHAQGHICPDCIRWLHMGPKGLKEEADWKLKEETEQGKREFYQSVSIVMEAASCFMNRYANEMEVYLENKEYFKYRETIKQVITNCRNLAQKPAQNFHEALQSVWFLFVILHMESNASSFSPGRLDLILWSYYERDMAAGFLSKEAALELIESLWLKFNEIVYLRNKNSAKYFAGFPIGFNVVLGGVDSNGRELKNDLSFLFLKAQEELGLPQPNLSVRLSEKTSDDFLEAAIKVVAKGSGMPQFFNDKAIIPALKKIGVNCDDAMNYAVVGCVELTSPGNSLGWSDAAMFNLNKALELTLTGGKCLISGEQIGPDYGKITEYETYVQFEDAFRKMLDYFIEKMVKACEKVEEAHIALLPTPFLSSVVNECMEKGMDVTAGGAKYNYSGIQMIQIANLADSLAALKQMVFEEKKISREELLKALKNNFEGYEVIRTMLLNKVPKYGNDVQSVDGLGAQWANYFQKKLSSYTNYRGGKYHTGMYTVSAHVPMGENVGASPDGRYSGTPLADGGMSPVYGRDVSGPTAVLKSVSRLDKTWSSNGGLLNMKFIPDFFKTEKGIQKFSLLLRGFVDLEIPHIQFNVVSAEDLIAAKKNPEMYRNLTVRVAGYTAYFTELTGKLQDEIIARTAYGDI